MTLGDGREKAIDVIGSERMRALMKTCRRISIYSCSIVLPFWLWLIRRSQRSSETVLLVVRAGSTAATAAVEADCGTCLPLALGCGYSPERS